MRSNWKLPITNPALFSTNLSKTKLFSRNSVILPSFVDSTLNVYNGKTFVKIQISSEIVGHKIGEFCKTRTRYIYKKGKKK